MLRTPGKRVFYLAYFGLLVCVFAYILFPADRMSAALSDRLCFAAPGCSVAIDRLRPTFPPGIHAAGVRLAFKNRDVIQIDSLKIAPRLLTLIQRQPSVSFKGSAYGGRFDGRTETVADGQGRHSVVNLKMSGIGLEKMARLRELTGHAVAGVLEGTMVVSTAGGVAESMSAALKVSDAVIETPAPVMTVSRFRFDRVAADIALGHRRLSIDGCRFQGPQMDGQIAGTIAVMRPFGASRIDLKGTLRPHTEFLATIKGALAASADFRRTVGEEGLSFQFSGTYDRPRIALAPGAPR